MQKSPGNEPRKEITEENPCWVDRPRLRRLHASLMMYKRTRSEFLLEWAQDEIMHIVRDS